MPFLFLSPSTQEFNPYITEGNEELWMNRLADQMEPYLHASGVNTVRNDPEAGAAGAFARALAPLLKLLLQCIKINLTEIHQRTGLFLGGDAVGFGGYRVVKEGLDVAHHLGNIRLG